MEYTAFINNAYRSRIIARATRQHQSSKIFSQTCTYTTTQVEGRQPIVHIPAGSHIYAFGAPSHTKTPLLRDLGWIVNDGEAWAIISGGGGRGKNIIFNVSFCLFFKKKIIFKMFMLNDRG